MKLTLYVNNSDDNVIGKDYTSPLELDIVLRKDVDIVMPSIRLELGINILGYNYCHIAGLDRFYFIRSIGHLSLSLWQLNLECDVLETYSSEILGSLARYRRKIRSGDFIESNLPRSTFSEVTMYNSDKGIDGEKTLILTTIGGING